MRNATLVQEIYSMAFSLTLFNSNAYGYATVISFCDTRLDRMHVLAGIV